jgi:predicted nucleic acid-binding protein
MPGAHKFFVDTNLFLYAIDRSTAKKRDRAWLWLEALWSASSGHISWQVLHEFYANAVGKMGVENRAARRFVHTYTQWNPVETTLALLERAWDWADQAHISYWDSLIVSAAERAGCDVLLSEDLQAGRRFGDVTIVNPFSKIPSEFGL